MKIHKLVLKNSNCLTLKPTQDAVYFFDFVNKKPLFSDIKIEVVLENKNVSCEIWCFCLLDEHESFKCNISVSHLALGTSSKVIFKGVLKDKSSLDFKGLVYISPKAFGSKTSLEDRVLIIGEGIYNKAEPMMKIENNNVEAAHASATGKLDESQIFYLRSRGLSKEESQDLLVRAFLSPPTNII